MKTITRHPGPTRTAARRGPAARKDARLDRALAEAGPASDPVAMLEPAGDAVVGAPDHDLGGYRSVLVHLSGSDAATLRAAVALASEFGAVLIGLSAVGTPAPVFLAEDPSLAAEVLLEERRVARQLIERGRRSLADAAAAAGLRAVEVEEPEFPTASLIRHASAADIVVIGHRGPDQVSTARYANAGEVVLRAGRPVLVIPHGAPAAVPRHVLIAWSETAEARRAVSDAMPLLRRASSVEAVTVSTPQQRSRAEESLSGLRAYLGRHGVAARTRVRTGDAGDVILEVAREAGADLIVAGAYGRNRFSELVFGGVTQSLLARSPVATLLSH